jgi:gamma-glutamylcyclotransferase
MLYFSYGSNMSTARLRERAPSVRVVTVAWLEKHKLAFHKRSKDGSGKCDAAYTGDTNDIVYGVVFEISALEKQGLDTKEGLGNGYEQKDVSIVADNGEMFTAATYYATNTDPSLRPYEWYKEHVLLGAREHGLPADYIASIEVVSPIPDPDRQRHEKELAVYR